MTIVDRTCTEIPTDGDAQNPARAGAALSEHRCTPAYVLLGDPGAGKTTSFEQEREHTSDAAEEVIPARDFVTFDVADHPEWHNRTLFIDGLDEIRAGSDDGRTALDRLRAKLDALGRPRFRLSCREADWLGRNDLSRLRAVAPSGELTVLRLDPLTPDDAKQICEADNRAESAERFMQEADDRGLEALLLNPQSLELLIKAVFGAGKWPESRRETFELACRQLTEEPNLEHKFSLRDRPSEEQVLKNAGRICALLLLSGTPGVSLLPTGEEHDVDYPPVERFDPTPDGMTAGEAEVLARRRRLALSSRLFAVVGGGYPAGQRFEPVHRHIAEFLAGRYLARQIQEGLPAARVIALITAGDGGVVTPHRGLAAWLAVHSKQARQELIERDPVGVGLYGDISSFYSRDKQSLLEALIREGRRLQEIDIRSVASFAPLAVPDLEAELRAKLTTHSQTDDDQLSAEFVLRVLRHCAPMPALVEPILAIVYQPDAWPRVAYAALDAFLRQSVNSDTTTAKLKQLLADIQEGRVPDPGNELLGRILDRLYPDAIPPAQIWSHLAQSQPTKLFGRHRRFWTRTLEQRTPADEVPNLLDGLARHASDLRTVLDQNRFPIVASRLLAGGLKTHGRTLEPSRLYGWLGAPADNYKDFVQLEYLPEAQAHLSNVRSWLEEHPEALKAALLEGLLRCAGEDDPRPRARMIFRIRFHGAEPPADFGSWSLEHARAHADRHPAVARLMFDQARHRLNEGESGDGLSQDLLNQCLQEHPAWLPPQPERERATDGELRESARQYEATPNALLEQRQRREREWLDTVRAEAPAMRENRGTPALLNKLAWDWFQRGSGRSPSLLRWLRSEFAEEDLATAAHQGLCGVTHRTDLPDVDEITRLHGESRMHYLSMPFLAALEEMARDDPASINDLTEEQQRRALASHFCVPTGGTHPGWYRRLVKENPDLAESVLLPFARAELRRGSEHVAGLYDLAHDPDHGELARLISLPLLRGFPVRCHARQLPNLIRLLWAALQHANQHELLELVDKKLAGKSMTVAQRVHWLAAGVVAGPDTHSTRLGEFIDGKELRARHLAHFLWSEGRDLFQPGALPPHVLEVLIRQLGSAFGVYELKDGIVGPREEALTRIPQLIERLEASPEPGAGAALHRLANDEALSRWSHGLRLAIDRQATISRDASYQRPGLDRIRATLSNAAPANAADLAALALDRLDDLAKRIRRANTNVWSQYWNQDSYGRPTRSKPEESCRDALLSHLRPFLPDEVEGQPEGQHAGNRRSDIRLSCSGFNVPVEIKKNSHPALWRAARDQLVAKYTSDPATGGYGIFVVLWFGDAEKTPLDETGKRPRSPEELQRRLEARIARQLAPEQARKIAVRVIDVTKP